ncbi:MAG: LysR family transcriptional regulator [Rhodospirillum sp.]|nr:LysR family transcriptional regulator [Rhodospirillum sp.]MCF8489125.1 LysR family transcriptional regulator [Rhodospirillum sp.]MCF8498915.1 LysR family transcriptional regulator [Rhodospirillum sp.]
MTLDQLRVFVAVAELQHVTKAARRLNLTQSAVSAAVTGLETRYGTPLFHRIGRGIQLTAEGAIFLEEARAVLDRAEAAERILTELSGLTRGALNVWASQTIASTWLPPLLHRFHQTYPGIRLEIRQGNTADVTAAVLSSAADLGFVEGSVSDPRLVVEKVAEDEMVLVTGREGDPDPADLSHWRWVLREKGSGTREVMERALAQAGLAPESLEIMLELPSNEAVCAAVAAGAGATVISRLAAAPRVALGELVVVGAPLIRRDFLAIRSGDRRPGRAEEALLGLARAEVD